MAENDSPKGRFWEGHFITADLWGKMAKLVALTEGDAPALTKEDIMTSFEDREGMVKATLSNAIAYDAVLERYQKAWAQHAGAQSMDIWMEGLIILRDTVANRLNLKRDALVLTSEEDGVLIITGTSVSPPGGKKIPFSDSMRVTVHLTPRKTKEGDLILKDGEVLYSRTFDYTIYDHGEDLAEFEKLAASYEDGVRHLRQFLTDAGESTDLVTDLLPRAEFRKYAFSFRKPEVVKAAPKAAGTKAVKGSNYKAVATFKNGTVIEVEGKAIEAGQSIAQQAIAAGYSVPATHAGKYAYDYVQKAARTGEYCPPFLAALEVAVA